MPVSPSRRVIFCCALVLLLVAVGLFAAACGGGTTSTTAAPATTITAAPATATTAAPAESTTTVAQTPQEFTFGMLLVGPYNDGGWSQANYEGGTSAEPPPGPNDRVDKVNRATVREPCRSSWPKTW
jgi:simple sugar transport system substrate-binding protein